MWEEPFVALDSASVALIVSHVAKRVPEPFTSEADLVKLRLFFFSLATSLLELISSFRFVADLALHTGTESAAFNAVFFVSMKAP